jgi:hypothetical protein
LGDWINWGQDLSDFLELPDWLLYQKWQLVQKSRAKEINAASFTGARLWAEFNYYIRAKGADEISTIEFPNIKDALPYDLDREEGLTKKTARIVCEAVESGYMPARIQQAFSHANPKFWGEIWKLYNDETRNS